MSRIGRNFERRCWRALTSSWRFTTTARYAESQARCRVEGTGRGFFQGLAVDPAHGGKKLGNVLFFTLCEELKRKGAHYMTFFVDDDNYARKIYDRAGGVVADSWKIMAKKGGSDHE